MNAVEAALTYRERGLFTVPVAAREKGSKDASWQHLRLTEAEIRDRFQADSNILLILGIDNITDVDLDSQEAIRAARFFLPPTGFQWGRATKPCSHSLYFLDKGIPFEKYVDPVGTPSPDDPKKITHETIAELRCLKKDGTIGLGTIIPPGVHKSKELIQFEPGADGVIATIEHSELSQAVRRTAAAALLAKYWPPSGGGRHEFEMALAGALCQGGIVQEAAKEFVLGAYQTLADYDARQLERVRRSVYDTYQKHASGVAHTGFTTMCEFVPKAVTVAALEWLGCASDGITWDEPLEIESALKPVLPLDPGTLPPLLADYCTDIATALVVPVEVPAVSVIVGASICIGNRAALQPKARETKWLQIPNLWGVVIGEPGTNKSGAMTEALAPLFELDKELQKESDTAKSENAKQMRVYKTRVAVHTSICKQTLREDANAPLPDEPIPPNKPPFRQIVIHESTPEKLHEKCTDNPNGLLCFADELASWFTSMEKKGHESERSLWLKGWTGSQSHCISTISRGDVFVDKLCLSVLGGTQPQKWRNYMREVVEGAGNDGLIQRLQLMIWPDDAPQKYTDIPRNDALIARVKARFRALLAIGAGSDMPVVYKFTPDAQEVFIRWWDRMAVKRERSNQPEAVESHFGKYKSLMPSLALIFQLFDDAPRRLFEDVETGPMPCVVDAVNTERAVKFCKWLVPHVERCYGCMSNSVSVEVLSARIKAGELGESFTYHEVCRKKWKALADVKDVKAALGTLSEALWVRYSTTKRRYYVNPKVRNVVSGPNSTF